MLHHLKPFIYIAASITFVFIADTGNSQYRFIPIAEADKATGNMNRVANEPAQALAESMPDSLEIISAYKNAKTVTDIEANNEKVVHALAKIRSTEIAILRLAATARSCEKTQVLETDGFQVAVKDVEGKVATFVAAVTDIELRMRKSFEAMPGRTMFSRHGKDGDLDFKRNEQLRRYQIAYSDFGRLRVQARELRKSISRASSVILNARCQPGNIPPLYEGEKVGLPRTASKKPLSIDP